MAYKCNLPKPGKRLAGLFQYSQRDQIIQIYSVITIIPWAPVPPAAPVAFKT